MKNWIARGVKQVPDWLKSKYRFKKDLTRLESPASYERMVAQYGINYIIAPQQVAELLSTLNVEKSKVDYVTFLGKPLYIKFHIQTY